jgi:hypothetical protein
VSYINFLIAKKCKPEWVPVLTWIFNVVILFEADHTGGFSGLFDYLGVGFLVKFSLYFLFIFSLKTEENFLGELISS